MAEVFKVDIDTTALEKLVHELKKLKQKDAITPGIYNQQPEIVSSKALQSLNKERDKEIKILKLGTKSVSILKTTLTYTWLGLKKVILAFRNLIKFTRVLSFAGITSGLLALIGSVMKKISASVGLVREARLLNMTGEQKLALDKTESTYETGGLLKDIIGNVVRNLQDNDAIGLFYTAGLDREAMTSMNGLDLLKTILKRAEQINTRYRDTDPDKNFYQGQLGNVIGGEHNVQLLKTFTDNLNKKGVLQKGDLKEILKTLQSYMQLYKPGYADKMKKGAYHFNEAWEKMKASFENLAIAASPVLVSIFDSLKVLFDAATPTIENTLNAVREFFKAPWDNIFKSIREGFINIVVAIFKPIVNIFKNGFGFDLKGLFGFTETKPIHKDKTNVADLPKKKEASSKNVKVDINVNDPGKIIKSITETQEGKAHYILSNGVN